jgi:hypothetical protein
MHTEYKRYRNYNQAAGPGQVSLAWQGVNILNTGIVSCKQHHLMQQDRL